MLENKLNGLVKDMRFCFSYVLSFNWKHSLYKKNIDLVDLVMIGYSFYSCVLEMDSFIFEVGHFHYCKKKKKKKKIRKCVRQKQPKQNNMANWEDPDDTTRLVSFWIYTVCKCISFGLQKW